METAKGYKYATIVLAIIVIILGWMLFAKSNPTVDTSLSNAGDKLAACNTAISDWKTRHATDAGSSTAQSELSDILDQCSKDIGGDTH